jgi:hypothetical protein
VDVQGPELEGKRVVVLTILRLQMLRRQEGALGPEDRREMAHARNVSGAPRGASRRRPTVIAATAVVAAP